MRRWIPDMWVVALTVVGILLAVLALVVVTDRVQASPKAGSQVVRKPATDDAAGDQWWLPMRTHGYWVGVRAGVVPSRTTNPRPLVRTSRTLVRTHPPVLPTGAIQAYAAHLVGPIQFTCLLPLWTRESHWNPAADNKHSSAFGIAQLLRETSRDPWVQVRHGLAYIAHRYGSACGAWAHSERTGWY